ncbi:MAG: hypothetical protein OEZ14_01665, partial [Acidimicrobiia bacterium]|nr:hypothetical protein [Acidimicrobiia bacterium]
KDMVCKDCALTVSGVRGSGKPEVRGDRRTVKSRRKAYAATEQPEDFFQFFDAGLPADALVAGPPPPPVSKSDREKAAAESSSAESADGSSAAADGTGIRRLLGRLKPNESERNEDDLVPIDKVLNGSGSGTDQNRADGAKDADAVSQLADIRRRGRDGETGRPADTPIDANETDGAPAASVLHEATELPPDSSVAIPSTLLQGFPDSDTDADGGHADEAEIEVQWSTAESMSAIAAAQDVLDDPQTDPSSPLGDGAGSTANAGPPPRPDANDHLLRLPQDDTVRHDAESDHPGDWMPPSDLGDVPFTEDPFGTPPDASEPPIQEERRRTLRAIGDYPAAPDQTGPDGNGGSRPIGPLDQIPDMSPRLRDLVADLSNQPSSSGPAENPFLKRSRVVSEPHAVPDFSTDPFSASDGGGSDSTPTDDQPRNRVPAPISPSSPAPLESAEAAAAPEPGTQPAPTRSQGASQPAQPLQPAQPSEPAQPPVEPITARTAVELPLEIPATLEPEPVSAVEAEDPITAAPELEPEPRIDPTLPIAATQDPEPATDTPPPSRRPIVSYTPAERHPLAAFADADRHPLAAFARRDTPSPTSEPPPIDDLFPDELAPVEVEYSVGRQPDFTDVPSIDDLLPPEAGETDVPPRGESLPASEPLDPFLPAEPVEHQVLAEPIEPDEPSVSRETWEPSPAWESWEPSESPQAAVPAETIEPDEPSESWETWQPAEPSEPAAPAESWELGDPTMPAAVVEVEPMASEHIPDVVSPESTVLETLDDDSATWTAVDDVPDLDGSTATQRADTDARGSWIPPALRGIAPDAQEAAENLPRRRR